MARRRNGKEFNQIDHRKRYIQVKPSHHFSGDRGHSPQEMEAKRKTSERIRAEIARRKKHKVKEK